MGWDQRLLENKDGSVRTPDRTDSAPFRGCMTSQPRRSYQDMHTDLSSATLPQIFIYTLKKICSFYKNTLSLNMNNRILLSRIFSTYT